MTRIQQVVDSLFDRFPPEELGGGPERDQFERLRLVLAGTEEWPGTLKRLYQADRCDDLALGLMWISDRLELDPSRLDAGPEEEEVFLRTLRRGLGLPEAGVAGFEWAGTALSPTDSAEFFAPTAEAPAFSEPTFEALPEPMPEPMAETTEDAPAIAMPTGEDEEVGTSDPDIYGRLLERFLEAVQSGSDDRAPLLERVRANCAAIRSDGGASEELTRYAEMVDDLLGYINDHQLLDDVRVMNLVANIQEPFAQWLSAAESDRAGFLDQSLETLKDFRTMFE